jgi:hypothetical protein
MSRVLGKPRRFGQNHGDRFADIAHDGDRNNGLRVGSDGRVRPTERNDRDFADVGAGEDRAHARLARRFAGRDAADRAVGARAAHKGRMPLAGPGDIVDERAAPAQEAQVFGALDRRPHIGVGPRRARRRLMWLHCCSRLAEKRRS